MGHNKRLNSAPRKKASASRHAFPAGFTQTDNRLYDSEAYAALCRRNPRAAVLLHQLHRFRFRGAPSQFKRDARSSLAMNGELGLPRKVVAPVMSKTAKARAVEDLIYAGFVE
jgi:hypothetical protein